MFILAFLTLIIPLDAQKAKPAPILFMRKKQMYHNRDNILIGIYFSIIFH